MLQIHSIKNALFRGANFGAYTDQSFYLEDRPFEVLWRQTNTYRDVIVIYFGKNLLSCFLTVVKMIIILWLSGQFCGTTSSECVEYMIISC